MARKTLSAKSAKAVAPEVVQATVENLEWIEADGVVKALPNVETVEQPVIVSPVDYAPWAWPRGEQFGLSALNLPKYYGPKAANSTGIALSWIDPEVKAARLTRNRVKVSNNGTVTEFKSVAEAFRALKLPFEKHIKFRSRVKAAAGEPVFFEHKGLTYAFEAVAA
ncbi:hypothetical protein IAG25_25480 [Caballeronia sp. EK]|uniref:hypothetical protein n=1 Tax=Caballeronia sp. EK TaxID=2767469 RepID=UPI001654CF2F|nr:hypothetical protein [Caballeronia sp. EK]MBC8640187.1 hypothetical protein [Caballeronia sp. EK]